MGTRNTWGMWEHILHPFSLPYQNILGLIYSRSIPWPLESSLERTPSTCTSVRAVNPDRLLSLFSVPIPLCSCVDHCTNPTQKDSDADSAKCQVALGLVMALFPCAGDCTSLSICTCTLNHRSVGSKGPLVQPSSWKGAVNT